MCDYGAINQQQEHSYVWTEERWRRVQNVVGSDQESLRGRDTATLLSGGITVHYTLQELYSTITLHYKHTRHYIDLRTITSVLQPSLYSPPRWKARQLFPRNTDLNSLSWISIYQFNPPQNQGTRDARLIRKKLKSKKKLFIVCWESYALPSNSETDCWAPQHNIWLVS